MELERRTCASVHVFIYRLFCRLHKARAPNGRHGTAEFRQDACTRHHNADLSGLKHASNVIAIFSLLEPSYCCTYWCRKSIFFQQLVKCQSQKKQATCQSYYEPRDRQEPSFPLFSSPLRFSSTGIQTWPFAFHKQLISPTRENQNRHICPVGTCKAQTTRWSY
jgi:hypothetical protein